MNKRSWIFVITLTTVLFFMNQFFFSPTPTPPAQEQTATKTQAPLPETQLPSGETFYVLENAFSQLVFSNKGGALAEINLPLHSKENPTSPVMPIEADKEMVRTVPENAYFPAFGYKTPAHSVEKGSLGGYYPLLRRTLKGPSGQILSTPAPKLYGLNVLAEDNSLDQAVYKVTRFEKDLIEFEFSQNNRRIVKTFSFPKEGANAPYCFDLSIRLEGDTKSLWLTSGVPDVEIISDNASPFLKYRQMKSGKIKVDEISLPKKEPAINGSPINWACNSNGFFGIILTPLSEVPAGFKALKVEGMNDPTRLSVLDKEYNLYPAEKYPGYTLQIPTNSKQMQVRVYAGPLEDDLLRLIDKTYTNPETKENPSYISALSLQGWFTFISEPFAKFLFILMQFFHTITTSWGISIILLTIALRIMLYPLNAWSIKSTVKMQQVSPKVRELQEKYKKDPKRAQMEIMTLYRNKGVNPLTGCIPLLIQLPFLIGMFDLLKSAFELRGVSFIPGWIDNLTAPDILFSWNYPILFFGTDFHLLPFFLGAVMWFQQRMTTGTTKGPLTDQQKQQKTMGNIMTVVFTIMFYHFPSGLNLYWLSSMALGVLQQWYTNRKMQLHRS